MRPNAAMASTCRQALAWYDEFPAARSLVESWQLRFARTVTSDKVFATVSRLAGWLEEHDSYRAMPGFFSTSSPSAERLAWDMVGGDAAVIWARDALSSVPAEEYSVITDTYDALEREADEREARAMVETEAALVASASAIQMAAEDWYSPEAFETLGQRKPQWCGVVLVEGQMTDDRRYLTPGGGTWRMLPFPLRTCPADVGAHDGAVAIGPFTGLKRSTPAEVKAMAGVDLPADSTPIWAHGLFDESEIARLSAQQIGNGTKPGVSVDLVDVTLKLPESPEDQDKVMMGELPLIIESYKIAGATQVDIPAFEFARLSIVGDLPSAPEEIEALVASGGRLEGLTFQAVMPLSWITSAPVEELAAVEPCDSFQPDGEDEKVCSQCGHRDYRHEAKAAADDVTELAGEPAEWAAESARLLAEIERAAVRKMSFSHPVFGGAADALAARPVGVVDLGDYTYTTQHLDALVASGGGLPMSHTPPPEWFEQQRYTQVTPKVISPPDEYGRRRFHGHAGVWGSCHIGREDICIDVPRGLDYASFQGPQVEGEVECEGGVILKAGPVVIDNVHPNLKLKASDAYAHYAYTRSMVAQVRCYEDEIGLQVQGWILPTVTADDLVLLRGASVSPDWRSRRMARGGRGVVCMLGVPVTGFNLGLVASGAPDDAAEAEPDDFAAVRALASRKVDALRRLGVAVSPNLEALAASIEPPEVSARKAAVLARLGRSESGCGCGCEGTCGVATG